MVVNKKGGNKTKKQKKVNPDKEDRKIDLKDVLEFQEYAQVLKVFGNSRYEANCFDGKVRLAHARGSLKKKKVFVKLGDVVIVSLREFEDAKCDIIHVYNQKEIKELKKLGEIPESITEDMIDKTEEPDIGVDITNDLSDSEDEKAIKRKSEFKADFMDNFDAI